MRFRCARCGDEHDLSDLEPSYARPDALDRIPAEQRERLAFVRKDFCVIHGGDDAPKHFVRVVLPISVTGRREPCSWGLWAKVTAATYNEVRELWEDATQLARGPWPAALANDIDGYPSTIGLPGTLRFVDPTQIPHFAFEADVVHPLATEWREGVTEDRLLEWQLWLLHGAH